MPSWRFLRRGDPAADAAAAAAASQEWTRLGSSSSRDTSPTSSRGGAPAEEAADSSHGPRRDRLAAALGCRAPSPSQTSPSLPPAGSGGSPDSSAIPSGSASSAAATNTGPDPQEALRQLAAGLVAHRQRPGEAAEGASGDAFALLLILLTPAQVARGVAQGATAYGALRAFTLAAVGRHGAEVGIIVADLCHSACSTIAAALALATVRRRCLSRGDEESPEAAAATTGSMAPWAEQLMVRLQLRSLGFRLADATLAFAALGGGSGRTSSSLATRRWRLGRGAAELLPTSAGLLSVLLGGARSSGGQQDALRTLLLLPSLGSLADGTLVLGRLAARRFRNGAATTATATITAIAVYAAILAYGARLLASLQGKLTRMEMQLHWLLFACTQAAALSRFHPGALPFPRAPVGANALR
eukprot:TRINITY_DN8477_c0_g1_i1.p1 TRINITY_DN8477_c0_g1~~TRINITY_DN8477_c0_g1_i1.p1  ORF type:complete len:456 (+),score=89.66 TRINITY_DN8477_c0_g1_i1:124-1368(+)